MRHRHAPLHRFALVDEEPNRLFIGHYVGNPGSWFLAWGRTLEEAAIYVDCEMGEPDMDSMREVVGPGMIEFEAKLCDPEQVVDDEQGRYAILSAGKHVSLGTGDGVEDNDDWIAERLKEPLGEPNEPTEFEAMGVTQRRLADAYRDEAGE